MFKTIFGKFMSINLVVILITMIVTGAFLFGLMADYMLNENKSTLIDEAKRVNELTGIYVNSNNTLVEHMYFMSIQDLSKRIEGVIFITDAEGNIVLASENASLHMRTDKIPPEAADAVIKGNTLAQLGNLGGAFSEIYMTVGSPFTLSGQIVGAIFLSVPSPEMNRMIYDMFSYFILAVSAAVLVAVALSYVLSKRLSRPLKEIGLAAKRIAQGDYETRVEVYGDDETAQLCKTFNNMAQSLTGLENMRSSFIANVSHELRTPMTTISGFIEGILDETIPREKSGEYLKVVLDETKRLARLVNELLVLARIEAGEVKLNMGEFDINELVRLTVLRFEKQITEKNISVDVSFESDPCIVIADRDALARVLTNLFDNALKFNIQNGYLKVNLKKQGRKVHVSVENSGMGISDEEKNVIWDRFYKSDKSRGHDKKGVGLGLFIVNSIISSHDEEIWLESKQGEFTRFIFSLKAEGN